MVTDRLGQPSEPGGRADLDVVQRYTRPVRWFHAGVYLSVLILLATGWWLLSGEEGNPSPLARLFGMPDTTLHKDVGWALAALTVAGILVGPRAVRTFVLESLRFRKPDLRWFIAWPAALVTGRFRRHEGHFDPGQRIMNVLLTLGLVILVGSGIGLVQLHGGPAFVVFARMHKWSTYAVTALLAGHILVAAGVLPGYRGVWRSMHLGGRLRVGVARRLWPGWLERFEQSRRQSGRQAQRQSGRHSRRRSDRSNRPSPSDAGQSRPTSP
jgi:cytochrome b subunit of formate dehydrogenase